MGNKKKKLKKSVYFKFAEKKTSVDDQTRFQENISMFINMLSGRLL
jgi:hypothetical protein